jgi:predicted rRNA methylase YqxC with S4 and FtsJ domains
VGGRLAASRGRGVIREPEVWRRALAGVHDALIAHGAAIMGVMVSPITGAEGTVEFLLHARTEPASAPGPVDLDAVVGEAAGRSRP